MKQGGPLARLRPIDEHSPAIVHGLISTRETTVHLAGRKFRENRGVWSSINFEDLKEWEDDYRPYSRHHYHTQPHPRPDSLGAFETSDVRFDLTALLLIALVEVPKTQHHMSLQEAETVLLISLQQAAEWAAKHEPKEILQYLTKVKEYSEDWDQYGVDAKVFVKTSWNSTGAAVTSLYYPLGRKYRFILCPVSVKHNGDVCFEMIDVDLRQTTLGRRLPPSNLMRDGSHRSSTATIYQKQNSIGRRLSILTSWIGARPISLIIITWTCKT